MVIKIIYYTIILFVLHYKTQAETKNNLPSIEEICNKVKNEIKIIEVSKRNLEKELKKFESDIEQFELLPEITKDTRKLINRQILQGKLYHYLECSKYNMK